MEKRYKDAYLQAKVVVGIGKLIKAVGLVLGILIALAGLGGGDSRLFVGGVLLGAMVALFFYPWGILVSAQGQILRATLDSAVHGSPFLQEREKAKVMGL